MYLTGGYDFLILLVDAFFLLPVLERRHQGVLFKYPDEISGIIVAGQCGDPGYAQIGRAQQFFCFGQTQLIAVLMNGIAGTAFELSSQIFFVIVKMLCKCTDRKIRMGIFFDVTADILNQGIKGFWSALTVCIQKIRNIAFQNIRCALAILPGESMLHGIGHIQQIMLLQPAQLFWAAVINIADKDHTDDSLVTEQRTTVFIYAVDA